MTTPTQEETKEETQVLYMFRTKENNCGFIPMIPSFHKYFMEFYENALASCRPATIMETIAYNCGTFSHMCKLEILGAVKDSIDDKKEEDNE